MCHLSENITSSKRVLHFGVSLKNSPKLQLTRENYAIIDKRNSIGNELRMKSLLSEEDRKAIYADENCCVYTDSWCENHRADCIKNFDLNMQYMHNLSSEDFNAALNKFLKKNRKLINIVDLNDCEYVEGIYIMVLDKYKQIYIGQSSNIKRRILSHWSKVKSFDRLIFGSVERSILSIDCFGALDTTRIYIYPTKTTFEEEARLVDTMDPRYLLNRTAGGIGMNNMYKLEIFTNAKNRNFEK